MQYNKYALALVLLAASAFAGVAEDAKKVKELLASASQDADNKFESLTTEQKTGLNLTPAQMTALESKNPDKNADILQILQDVYVEEIFKLGVNGKISASDFEKYNDFQKILTKEKYDAIKAHEDTGKLLTADQLKAYIFDGAALPSAAPRVLTSDYKIAKINSMIDMGVNGKISASEFERYNDFPELLTQEKYDAIKAYEDTGKLLTAGELKAYIFDNGTLPNESKSVENLSEDIMKNHINSEGKLKEDSKAALKLAGISEHKINKLVAVDKLTKDEVDKILNSVDSNPDGNNPVGTGGSSSSVAIPFYQNKLFIGVVVVLVLASIGGGAYMMTHKSEETDL